MRPRNPWLGWLAPLSFALWVLGCGDDPPGPGASSIAGNVSTAETGAAPDTGLGGIVIIARAGVRETSGVTDSEGRFLLGKAPTGEVTILLRRGDCEASLPLGGVVSRSSIGLVDMSFLCESASADRIEETFDGVARRDPGNDLRICTRVGDDDRSRTVSTQGATVVDRQGQTSTVDAIRKNDLLEVEGTRSGSGSSFTFETERIRVLDRGIKDACDDDPFT